MAAATAKVEGAVRQAHTWHSQREAVVVQLLHHQQLDVLALAIVEQHACRQRHDQGLVDVNGRGRGMHRGVRRSRQAPRFPTPCPCPPAALYACVAASLNWYACVPEVEAAAAASASLPMQAGGARPPRQCPSVRGCTGARHIACAAQNMLLCCQLSLLGRRVRERQARICAYSWLNLHPACSRCTYCDHGNDRGLLLLKHPSRWQLPQIWQSACL